MRNSASPVAWARWPGISEFLANAVSPSQPPILVVSLPRSGSSWVGEVLGASSEAMYLREPITQSHLATGKNDISVFFVSPDDPPLDYLRFADAAFGGLPAFGPNIVKRPNQWSLFKRGSRRVLIKEVNPLAVGWLAERFGPQILFLVRHPVAVSNSYYRLGWRDVNLPERLPKTQWEAIAERFPELDGFWEEHAAFQGSVTRMALDMLEGYEGWKLIRYEDLCQDPETVFRSLYEFTGLSWDDASADLVTSKSRQPANTKSGDDPYSTARDSKQQIYAWREAVDSSQLKTIRDVYSGFHLPLYTEEQWWIKPEP